MEKQLYDYKRPETGEIEKVELERWAWGVIYKDGTELHQFDSDNKFHQMREIDQKNVALFILHKSDDWNKRIDIVIPEGARLIHKYRNIKPYWSKVFIKIYVFGYRTGKDPDFSYHYNFILPNDNVIQSTVENVDLMTFLAGANQ